MQVLRKIKKGNYTVIDNDIFKDRDLSLKAKGLLCLMLSLPDNWNFSIAGLATLSKDGETAIRNTLNELKNEGYFRRRQVRKNGKIAKIEYVISEVKNCENLVVDFPQQEKPQQENHAQLNTNKSNTYFDKDTNLYSCSSVLSLMTEDECDRLFSIYKDADLLVDAIDEELRLKNKFSEIRNAYRYAVGYAEKKQWSRYQV